MDTRDAVALVGAGATLFVGVAHAAITWWRVGDHAKQIEEHDDRLDSLEKWRAGEEVAGRSIARRVAELEEEP